MSSWCRRKANWSCRTDFTSTSSAGIQTPGFFVYRPARPNGLGLLIIPGGAYAREALNRGARDIADYFTGLGITCFVLRYRLPGEGWENRETVAAAGRAARHAPDQQRRL